MLKDEYHMNDDNDKNREQKNCVKLLQVDCVEQEIYACNAI